ncbi:MAG TPA: glycosyltransferase family 4 protein [Nitrospira sp.]|nr:glycosyltransferase family 4 protein [Nitrospira sp.]
MDTKGIRVCHLAVGDRWGGAEVCLVELMKSLVKHRDLDMSAIVLNHGRLVKELSSLGVQVLVISESEVSLLKTLRKIVQQLKSRQYHIIHSHKPKDNVLGVLAGLLSSRPVIVRTVHGSPEMFPGISRIRMALHELPNQVCNRVFVDQVIAVSEDLKSQLTKYYGQSRVVCIHNGISLPDVNVLEEQGQVRSKIGLAKGDFLIGTVGRLSAVKGCEFLIKAVPHLCRICHNFKVLFVGEGPLKSSLERLAESLRIRDRVIFMGHHDFPIDIVREMDVFVLPSLNEGIPLALLEAMSLQRPVVAAKVGGVPEVVRHELNGLLIESHDAQAIASACGRLLRDRVLRRSLGEAARIDIEKCFSSVVMGDNVAALYRKLLREFSDFDVVCN